MSGVLVNTVAVVIGSLIGLLCKKGIPQRISRAVMIGIGLCTIYIGISGSLSGENTLVAIFSMVAGAIIGTLLKLDDRLNGLGDMISRKIGGGGSSVAEGFVTASLLFCMGSMTIVGSLNAGISGNNELLYTKSLLDFISSIMLSASLGIGVLCSSVFVLVFQGGIVLLSGLLAPVLTQGAINEMTCVGSLLIIALGLNLTGLSRFKVADYLPAILLAPAVYWLYQTVSSLLAGLLG